MTVAPRAAITWPMDPVQRFEGGYLLTNSYLVTTPGGGVVMIDAPIDADRWLDQLGARPLALLLTHQHFDHVMSAAAIAARGIPVYAFAPFSPGLTLEEVVREWGMPFDVAPFAVDHVLEGRGELEIDGLRLGLRHLPGHSDDSLIFLDAERELLFAGDTLFHGSTGRGDLPGGNLERLCHGITEQIYPLPDATRVFPGHGPETLVGSERATNPIVRG